MILKLWKKTLEGKKKQLVEHQGVVSGTPESSDDEDEEDDEHNSRFCAVESQRYSSMVPPNERMTGGFCGNIIDISALEKKILSLIVLFWNRAIQNRKVLIPLPKITFLWNPNIF